MIFVVDGHMDTKQTFQMCTNPGGSPINVPVTNLDELESLNILSDQDE